MACRRLAAILVLGVLVAAGAAGAHAQAVDPLLRAVRQCVRPEGASPSGSCCAAAPGHLCAGQACNTGTHEWAQQRDAAGQSRLVAIADRKMCEARCSRDHNFVHGLVIPVAEVSGIERTFEATPAGLEDMWSFGWRVAREAALTVPEIALVINPRGGRTRDQLHMHIVRRLDASRDLTTTRAGEQVVQAVSEVGDLAEVWDAARAAAGAHDFRDYGVVVTRNVADTKYLVVVVKWLPTSIKNPESRYTHATCK